MLKYYKNVKIILYLFVKGENNGYKFSRVLVYMTVIWYIDFIYYGAGLYV